MRRSASFGDAYANTGSKTSDKSFCGREGHRNGGFTLLGLAITLTLSLYLVRLSILPIRNWYGAERVKMASVQIEGAFHLARLWAIQHQRNVAVKFNTERNGRVWVHLYGDGDGDGVRNKDIDAGIDPEVKGPQQLGYFGDNVGFGFIPGHAPRDPSNPNQRLDRLEDPIRFNRSDLAAFSALGTATPGTVYISDRRRHLAMVRVTGTTGRIRIRTYDLEGDRWHD